MSAALLLGLVLIAARPVPPRAPAPAPVACPPLPPPPPASTSVRVMLPDLEVTARFADARGALTQVVAAEAGRVHGYELLSADEVRAVVAQEANKQLLGCDDTGCLAELAEALDAELVVSGRIGETPDGSPLVSLTLINVGALVVMNRVTVEWRGPVDKLADVVRVSAQRLLIEAKDRPPGGLTLTGAPAEARVLVDGVDRTREHAAGRVANLEIGVHDVSVEAPDKIPTTIAVVVMSDVDSVVDASLEDVPVPAVWLWVGGVSAVVVSAAATGALIYFNGPATVAVDAKGPNLTDVEALRSLGK